jgi:DNA polymerase-1
MNMQNWPHDLLSYLLADEGYLFYSFDLSQIENRIVAYVGNIQEMIDAFESGKDLHRLTGALIFRIPYAEVSDEPGSCSLGGGKHSQRFWGKKGNHSLNYDYGYKDFALKHEITETDAKFLVERYHSSYPGVRESYHGGIQICLRKNRTLTNLFGRRRVFLGKLENKTFKEAYAQIPQSTTADKINRQGLNYIYFNQHWFEHVELLLQVHDSIGFQIPLPPKVSWLEHASILTRIKDSLETPLVTPEWWGEREFIVPADLTVGLTLNKNDGVEVKASDYPQSQTELADVLRKAYYNCLGRREVSEVGEDQNGRLAEA